MQTAQPEQSTQWSPTQAATIFLTDRRDSLSKRLSAYDAQNPLVTHARSQLAYFDRELALASNAPKQHTRPFHYQEAERTLVELEEHTIRSLERATNPAINPTTRQPERLADHL
jgi:hypothetical protein